MFYASTQPYSKNQERIPDFVRKTEITLSRFDESFNERDEKPASLRLPNSAEEF
jgi:hypothetical protein